MYAIAHKVAAADATDAAANPSKIHETSHKVTATDATAVANPSGIREASSAAHNVAAAGATDASTNPSSIHETSPTVATEPVGCFSHSD